MNRNNIPKKSKRYVVGGDAGVVFFCFISGYAEKITQKKKKYLLWGLWV